MDVTRRQATAQASTATLPFSERLRAAAQEAWDEVQRHPLARRAAHGSLDPAVLDHHLAQDRALVVPLIRLAGHAIAASQDRDEQRALAAFVQRLCHASEPDGHGLPPGAYLAGQRGESTLYTPTAELRQVILDAATGGGHEDAAVILLGRAWPLVELARSLSGPAATPRLPWLAVAASTQDLDLVATLRRTLDRAATALGPERQARLAQAFRWTVELQVHMWDAALVARDPPVPATNEDSPAGASAP